MRCASKQRAAATIFYHLLRSWLVNIMNSGGAMPNEDEVRKRKGERGKGSPPLPLDFTSFFCLCPSADLPTSHRISRTRATKRRFPFLLLFLPPSLARRPFGLWVILSPLHLSAFFFLRTLGRHRLRDTRPARRRDGRSSIDEDSLSVRRHRDTEYRSNSIHKSRRKHATVTSRALLVLVRPAHSLSETVSQVLSGRLT